MKFENEELKTTFELPDRMTPRIALKYFAISDFGVDQTLYERLWPAACAIVQEWSSEIVPIASPALLDDPEAMESKVIDVIKWASLSVFAFIRGLQATEKN